MSRQGGTHRGEFGCSVATYGDYVTPMIRINLQRVSVRGEDEHCSEWSLVPMMWRPFLFPEVVHLTKGCEVHCDTVDDHITFRTCAHK